MVPSERLGAAVSATYPPRSSRPVYHQWGCSLMPCCSSRVRPRGKAAGEAHPKFQAGQADFPPCQCLFPLSSCHHPPCCVKLADTTSPGPFAAGILLNHVILAVTLEKKLSTSVQPLTIISAPLHRIWSRGIGSSATSQ